MKKILFIGFHHRKSGPRLKYREMKLIDTEIDDSQIFMLNKDSREEVEDYRVERENHQLSNGTVENIDIIYPSKEGKSIFKKIFHKLKLTKFMIETVVDLNPDVIQASHALELFLTFLFGAFTQASLIYDSHEDYVRQKLDYKEKSPETYFVALKMFFRELFWIKFFDQIYCTDEYLLEKYQRWYYNSKNVTLLRNFPFVSQDEYEKLINREYKEKDELKLVYIGGVNEYRGVIECVNYIRKFNSKYDEKELFLDIYSGQNNITERSSKNDFVNHTPWIDYKELMELLPTYDVGVCLLLPIKKFYRNLPLKNFDYMGVGLPIITSDFGNLKKYMEFSNSGICIDPKSYDQFEEAILEMFSPKKRENYSKNGLNFVYKEASFQNEGEEYIDYLKNV